MKHAAKGVKKTLASGAVSHDYIRTQFVIAKGSNKDKANMLTARESNNVTTHIINLKIIL